MSEAWFQDSVGWSGKSRKLAGEAQWEDGVGGVLRQTYPDLDGKRFWTVRTQLHPTDAPLCAVPHPTKGGWCALPAGHDECPHVWHKPYAEPRNYVLSISVSVPVDA